MNFEAKNLPYSLFEKIGMSRKDVLGLPKEDLLALLSGRTTSLRELKVETESGTIKEKAKLSVYALPDNSLAIRVHPIRPEIKNEFDLKPKELEALKAGGLVIAPKTSQNGELEKHIFQLDKEINEIKSIRANSVNIPNQIDNVPISTKQKAELLEGKPIDLVNKNGEVRTVVVDLLSQKGYSVLNENKAIKEGLQETLNTKVNSYRELLNKSVDGNRTIGHRQESGDGLVKSSNGVQDKRSESDRKEKGHENSTVTVEKEQTKGLKR